MASFLLSGFVMYFCCWNCNSKPFRCKLLKTALDHDFLRFPFDGTKLCIDPAPSTSTNDLANMKLLERKFWFGGPDDDAATDAIRGEFLDGCWWWWCCCCWWWCCCCCWYLSIACVRTLYEGWWYWSVNGKVRKWYLNGFCYGWLPT